jgi:hypothetical protein
MVDCKVVRPGQDAAAAADDDDDDDGVGHAAAAAAAADDDSDDDGLMMITALVVVQICIVVSACLAGFPMLAFRPKYNRMMAEKEHEAELQKRRVSPWGRTGYLIIHTSSSIRKAQSTQYCSPFVLVCRGVWRWGHQPAGAPTRRSSWPPSPPRS